MSTKNYSNNFFGNIDNVYIHQGNNNSINNSTIDYETILKIINEIRDNADLNSEDIINTKVKNVLDITEDAAIKKDDSKLRMVLQDLKSLLTGTASSLIASWIWKMILAIQGG